MSSYKEGKRSLRSKSDVGEGEKTGYEGRKGTAVKEDIVEQCRGRKYVIRTRREMKRKLEGRIRK